MQLTHLMATECARKHRKAIILTIQLPGKMLVMIMIVCQYNKHKHQLNNSNKNDKSYRAKKKYRTKIELSTTNVIHYINLRWVRQRWPAAFSDATCVNRIMHLCIHSQIQITNQTLHYLQIVTGVAAWLCCNLLSRYTLDQKRQNDFMYYERCTRITVNVAIL